MASFEANCAAVTRFFFENKNPRLGIAKTGVFDFIAP